MVNQSNTERHVALALSESETSLPILIDAKNNSVKSVRVDNGLILPATGLLMNSTIFILALCATVFFTSGLLIMFPWQNMIKAFVYFLLSSLFMLITLLSIDWFRGSVNEIMWRFEHSEESVTAQPPKIGIIVIAKNGYWKIFLGFSAAYICLSYIGFYSASLRTGFSHKLMTVMGWTSIALVIYTMAVSFDVKKASRFAKADPYLCLAGGHSILERTGVVNNR